MAYRPLKAALTEDFEEVVDIDDGASTVGHTPYGQLRQTPGGPLVADFVATAPAEGTTGLRFLLVSGTVTKPGTYQYDWWDILPSGERRPIHWGPISFRANISDPA